MTALHSPILLPQQARSPGWSPCTHDITAFPPLVAAVGVDQAILDLPATWPFKTLKGWLVGLSWRGFETWRQVGQSASLVLSCPWQSQLCCAGGCAPKGQSA